MFPSEVSCTELVCNQSLAWENAGLKAGQPAPPFCYTDIAQGGGAAQVLMSERIPGPHQLHVVVEDQDHVAEDVDRMAWRSSLVLEGDLIARAEQEDVTVGQAPRLMGVERGHHRITLGTSCSFKISRLVSRVSLPARSYS